MANAPYTITYEIHHGNNPHVYWIDLYNNGTLHECLVLKRDPQNSLFFIVVNDLDPVDKMRIAKILADPRAGNFELYDLLNQKTLQNGVNALTYFHQFVKILTYNGKIFDPRAGLQAATGQVSSDVNANQSADSESAPVGRNPATKRQVVA